MAFEYANKLISAKARMIFFGLCRSSDPGATTQDSYTFTLIYILFVPAHNVLKCIFYVPFDVHQGTHSSLLCADIHFSVLSSFIGLALMSGTTRIHAIQTLM